MIATIRRMVRERSGGRCEYCRIHERDDPFYSFHVEHILSRQHGGDDRPDNLAWSCHECNWAKGPNLSGRDDDSGNVVTLFHPRFQSWQRHFRWDGPRLAGKTQIGRATIRTLKINAPHRVATRELLIELGVIPPDE